MNKSIFIIMLACCFFVSVVPGISGEIKNKTFKPEEIEQMSRVKAVLQTKFGDISIRFFPDLAPNHVNSFFELAKSGFYDGTTFHRIIPGFMIQGGDPNSKTPNRRMHGTGGPGYSIKAEFSDRDHKRGTLSMARSANPDSAGSQFFICVADAPHLNKQYTVFGEVVKGLDVVDKIVSQKRDRRDNPLEKIDMKIKILLPEETKEKQPEKKK